MKVNRYDCGYGEGMFEDTEGSWVSIEDYEKLLYKYNTALNIDLVSKSVTDKQINEVADDMADDYCNDVTDPVWREIRKDSIKAIKAFIDKHL